MLEKCVPTILELNWNQRLGHKRTNLNISVDIFRAAYLAKILSQRFGKYCTVKALVRLVSLQLKLGQARG